MARWESSRARKRSCLTLAKRSVCCQIQVSVCRQSVQQEELLQTLHLPRALSQYSFLLPSSPWCCHFVSPPRQLSVNWLSPTSPSLKKKNLRDATAGHPSRLSHVYSATFPDFFIPYWFDFFSLSFIISYGDWITVCIFLLLSSFYLKPFLVTTSAHMDFPIIKCHRTIIDVNVSLFFSSKSICINSQSELFLEVSSWYGDLFLWNIGWKTSKY